MAKTFLLDPESLADRLRLRCRNQRAEWLAGHGSWPLRCSLGPPNEAQAMQQRDRVLAWRDTWANWNGPAQVHWVEKRWSHVGKQRLPDAVSFDSADAVASFLGNAAEWSETCRRFTRMTNEWPMLATLLPSCFNVLSQWPEEDFDRLTNLLRWLSTHSCPGLSVRQLPVPGLDSKWIETRQKVVRDCLQKILCLDSAGDLYAMAGLRRLPTRLRMRLLDPALRHRLAWLGDVQAPVGDLARLELPIQLVLIVENLQTGLAFDNLPDAVVFMGQGYEVDPFGELPWLQKLPCLYWGDLDTHGFAILDRLRQHLPQTRSLLMDRETLFAHRSLWGVEESPAKPADLARLSPDERELYTALRDDRFGSRIRLEQERIDWAYALERTGEEYSRKART